MHFYSWIYNNLYMNKHSVFMKLVNGKLHMKSLKEHHTQ